MRVVWGSENKENNNLRGGVMETTELAQYFNENLFLPNLKAKTKADSFNEIAELFAENKIVRDKNIVVEMLEKRETLGSTGIGKGVAIPHGRTTAALDVTIAFCKSEKGIDFNSVDKQPVNLIFTVLAPPQDENNRYLPILGKLVEFLHEAKNRKKLLDVTTFDEFIQTIKG